MDLHFAWQVAWQAWHCCVAGVVPGDMDGHLHGRRGTLRGTWRPRPSLCVAGVALHGSGRAPVARLVPIGRRWSPWLFSVAVVILGDMDLNFAWQPWHFCVAGIGTWRILATWIFTLSGRLRGRRGTVAWQVWYLRDCQEKEVGLTILSTHLQNSLLPTYSLITRNSLTHSSLLPNFSLITHTTH